MTARFAGSLLCVGALVVFVVLTVRHELGERRKQR
jgi:hypothetical protein